MSNVVLDCGVSGSGTESDLHEWIASLKHTDTDRTLFAQLYTDFLRWQVVVVGGNAKSAPSRRWLSAQLRNLGFRVETRGGSVYVIGLALGCGG